MDLSFTEETAHEKGFSEYFEREVEPLLLSMETKRQELQTEQEKRKRMAPVLYVIEFLGGILLAFLTKSEIALLISCFGPVATLVWIARPDLEFQNMQHAIVPKLAGFFGEFTYIREDGLSADAVEKSKIIPNFDKRRMTSYQTLSGTHKGKRVDISHVTVGYKHDDGTSRIFNGVMVLTRLPKRKFEGLTVVRDNIYVKDDLAKSRRLEKVTLESNDFEREFATYSSNQIEARYLLSPDVMHELLELAKDPRSQNLDCSFTENVLCIAMNGAPDLFPTSGLDRTPDDMTNIRRFLDRMSHALNVADALDG